MPRRITGKKSQRLPVGKDGSLVVDTIAQVPGHVEPEDWQRVTTRFKEKDVKRRLKKAENKKAMKAMKAKNKARAKAKMAAKKRQDANLVEVVPWKKYLNREHSKLWHREVKEGMSRLGLSKDRAK